MPDDQFNHLALADKSIPCALNVLGRWVEQHQGQRGEIARRAFDNLDGEGLFRWCTQLPESAHGGHDSAEDPLHQLARLAWR
jgi:hypothetical protein